jgi:hypothetical protein
VAFDKAGNRVKKPTVTTLRVPARKRHR